MLRLIIVPVGILFLGVSWVAVGQETSPQEDYDTVSKCLDAADSARVLGRPSPTSFEVCKAAASNDHPGAMWAVAKVEQVRVGGDRDRARELMKAAAGKGSARAAVDALLRRDQTADRLDGLFVVGVFTEICARGGLTIPAIGRAAFLQLAVPAEEVPVVPHLFGQNPKAAWVLSNDRVNVTIVGFEGGRCAVVSENADGTVVWSGLQRITDALAEALEMERPPDWNSVVKGQAILRSATLRSEKLPMPHLFGGIFNGPNEDNRPALTILYVAAFPEQVLPVN